MFAYIESINMHTLSILFLDVYIEGEDWKGLVFQTAMPANERRTTFRISITNDDIPEQREYFTFELKDPTTAHVLRDVPYEAKVTITDDDNTSNY